MPITCRFLFMFPFLWEDKGIFRVARSGIPEIATLGSQESFQCSIWLIPPLAVARLMHKTELLCQSQPFLPWNVIYGCQSREKRCLVGVKISLESSLQWQQPSLQLLEHLAPKKAVCPAETNITGMPGIFPSKNHIPAFCWLSELFTLSSLTFLLFSSGTIREFPTLWGFFPPKIEDYFNYFVLWGHFEDWWSCMCLPE